MQGGKSGENPALSRNCKPKLGESGCPPVRINSFTYSGSHLIKVQEPYPQPLPRKQGGGYDVLHVS